MDMEAQLACSGVAWRVDCSMVCVCVPLGHLAAAFEYNILVTPPPLQDGLVVSRGG